MPDPARSLVLGTAGHIDHGKTALVRALTGVDTDRLLEEKRRGITIELGFARYDPGQGCAFGVVDVPGHEGFVRTMVAGATGVDVVLMVVAADEGVMPQTREHMAIVGLLGVAEMVVAVTKRDLVDDEWLELVEEDVAELLAGTPYEDAEVVPTSMETGEGMAALASALVRSGSRAATRATDDLFRLPADRVFAVEGAGTVVTGTLWSGSVARGSTVRILPDEGRARVRSVQVHGEQVEAATAGQRTALALTGTSVRRRQVARGDVLVTHPSWSPAMMLTVQVSCLPDTGWQIEAGQRVRIHLGTVEVLGRVALFGADKIGSGETAFAQLRLEGRTVARRGDRFVVRSYSPVTTIAGGIVLEPDPPKRKRLSSRERIALEGLAQGGISAAKGAVALAGWQGMDAEHWAVRVGAAPPSSERTAAAVPVSGAFFAPEIVSEGEARILAAVEEYHRQHALESGAPLDVLRTALPARSFPKLADGLVARLVEDGRLAVESSKARLPEFEAVLSDDEAARADRLMAALNQAGLRGPTTEELGAQGADAPKTLAVLAFLADRGRVRLLGDAYWVATDALAEAADRVARELGGRTGLGPADFREVLPVTRKHLIPILAHLDAEGITFREESGLRRVTEGVPG